MTDKGDWTTRGITRITGPDANEGLYSLLGEFIYYYTAIERTCHFLFDRLSGLKPPISRAMIGGERLSRVIGLLNKLVASADDIPEERKKDFAYCIEHLNHLTVFRHNLIHRGAHTEPDGEILTSNLIIAKSEQAIEMIRFHATDLKAAIVDTNYMAHRLIAVKYPNLLDVVEPAFREEMLAPWRYKPVQPEKRRPTRPEGS